MTLPKRWHDPSLTDDEVRAIEERRRDIKKRLSGLNIKPTKSGEVGFRPVPPGEPWPPTPLELWEKEQAAKKGGPEER